jgi:L,D-transpeptidase YcbB
MLPAGARDAPDRLTSRHTAQRLRAMLAIMMVGRRRVLQFLLLQAAAARALGAHALIWFRDGRPTEDAVHAVQVLRSAADHGLEPHDYQAAQLGREFMQTLHGPMAPEVQQALLDAGLTAALHRYLQDLQHGRVDPPRANAGFHTRRRDPVDAVELLREAAAGHGVREALARAEPALPMYAALRQALSRYRELEQHAAWQQPLPPLSSRNLAGGQAWAGLPLLARRLQAVGDLIGAAGPHERFDEALVTALQSFQRRHGLVPDGILGRATLGQLQVPLQARVRQIELSMERLRWTPLLQAPRMIVVNIPECVLRACEVHDGRVDVRLTMKVIVGKALDARTPMFEEDVRFIEFSPYWNVPASIARDELVPRLRREPAHFDREGFEFVTGTGEVVGTLSADHLDAVLQGGWRLRQRPGPRNAMGDIKFIVPNNAGIYLHHTSSPQLFERSRRDLSHGCIRVEDPVGLARFMLHDAPDWTEDRIREAMASGVSRTLRLNDPLPVRVAYSTVIAKGQEVFFYPDLYGHDRLLDDALRARSARLAPPIHSDSGPS